MSKYELLDEGIEIPGIPLGALLDDMADLDTFGHGSAVPTVTRPHGVPLTKSLTVTIDEAVYTIGYKELIKAFALVLDELRTYPGAILTSQYVQESVRFITTNEPDSITNDELLEDLFKLALEAVGWKENP